jgi:hypothetical protein
MAFNTGLFWMNTGAGLVSSSAYTTTGTVKTKAALQADMDDSKIAVIKTNGARAVFVKPLMLSGGAGTGSGAEANLAVYGVMGFGEPTQKNYSDSEKFVWALGTVDICDSSTNNPPATASTVSIFTTPGGTEFTSFTGAGDAADQNNETFAKLSAMNTSPPDCADIELNNVDVGFSIFPGIEIFSEIIVSFTIGAVHTDSKANALINLHY